MYAFHHPSKNWCEGSANLFVGLPIGHLLPLTLRIAQGCAFFALSRCVPSVHSPVELVPVAGFAPALATFSTLCLCLLGYTGIKKIGRSGRIRTA